MKNSKKYISTPINCLLLLLFALVIWGCESTNSDTTTQTPSCTTLTNLEGVYNCSGECVLTDDKGNRALATVTVEADTIESFSGSKELYQIKIGGKDGFHELEIGAFDGLILRTATAEVSDTLYPVLEEYVFESNTLCEVVGYTKIVRNPIPASFKTCVIHCKKSPN